MKKIQLYGIGSALVDVIVHVDESFLSERQFEKGTMRLFSNDEQRQLLSSLDGKDQQLVSGGSVGNSVYLFSQLGGRAGYFSLVADDVLGHHFYSEFAKQGIALQAPRPLEGEATGSCISLITPDAERTMRTCLGINGQISPQTVLLDGIEESEWLFIEGYLCTNAEGSRQLINEAAQKAKAAGSKIALTLSEAWVVQTQESFISGLVPHLDLLFANASEAMALAQCTTPEEAFEKLRSTIPMVVVTQGAEPALIGTRSSHVQVQPRPRKPVDLTGAGDAFAAAFLYGLCEGYTLEDSGKLACEMAGKVVEQVGARLQAID